MSHSTTDGTDATAGEGASAHTARRRPPLWLLILAGALVVALVVVAVVVLGNRGESEEIPVAETVTLAVPTPTVDAIQREPGTAFLDSLPSTVLAYSLTEVAEHPPLLAGGALEGYRLVYSDGGGTDLTVLAGQWRDAASAQAVLDQVVAAQPPAGTVVTLDPSAAADDGDGDDETTAVDDEAADDGSAGETAEPTDGTSTLEVTQGSVEVDGAQVGAYLIVPHADGTGTAWWTNGTVLIQVDGPAAALRDFYAAFPL